MYYFTAFFKLIKKIYNFFFKDVLLQLNNFVFMSAATQLN